MIVHEHRGSSPTHGWWPSTTPSMPTNPARKPQFYAELAAELGARSDRRRGFVARDSSPAEFGGAGLSHDRRWTRRRRCSRSPGQRSDGRSRCSGSTATQTAVGTPDADLAMMSGPRRPVPCHRRELARDACGRTRGIAIGRFASRFERPETRRRGKWEHWTPEVGASPIDPWSSPVESTSGRRYTTWRDGDRLVHDPLSLRKRTGRRVAVIHTNFDFVSRAELISSLAMAGFTVRGASTAIGTVDQRAPTSSRV